MQPFCTSEDYSFSGSIDVVIQNDPNDNTDYGCLNTYPNPTWYYMEILVGGDMDIEIRSLTGGDVDFALWGPFDDLSSAIAMCDNYDGPQSCSYSPDPQEVANLRGAVAGQTWVLLVTNYENSANEMGFRKIDGSGSAETDCGLLTCDGEVSMNNAFSTCGSASNGDTCYAQCAAGYELTSGSLLRTCDDGDWSTFTGVCSLINACAGVNCPMYSNCIGGECYCWNDYVNENGYCVEIDMCADMPCDRNAVCRNIDGSTDFTCTCNPGFSGDGFFCEMPVDDCEEEEECCDTVRKSTNVINVVFADIFAGYDGYISADPDCCDGCGCGN